MHSLSVCSSMDANGSKDSSTQVDVIDNNVSSYPPTIKMPVKSFVERTTLRDMIREQFNRDLRDGRKGEIRKVGIYGLGGVGKSQLALSYLRQYRDDYDATFWIQAGQTTSIVKDFLNIFHLLYSGAEVDNQLSADKVLLAVHKWFNQRQGKWLFVFDGADELDYSDDIRFVDIDQYVPRSHAHVILTSRSRTARNFSTFEGVEVRELEEAQATNLFLQVLRARRAATGEGEGSEGNRERAGIPGTGNHTRRDIRLAAATTMF
jgi:hypothetical protein